MKESSLDVDKLLQQMALKQPSAELDRRIEESVPPFLTRDGWSTRKPNPVLLHFGLGVGSSLCGLVFGLMIASAIVENRARASVERGDGSRSVTASTSDGAAKEQRSGLDNLTVNSSDQATGLQGPPVAVLCAMSSRTAPGDERKRCTKCHTEATDGAGSFEHGYVQRFHRKLCARCHDMSGALENWHLPEIDDAIGDQPWHQPEKRNSPTG